MIEELQATRRRDLGLFLRRRRSSLHPGDLGLPAGGRRHVRGLRRNEVAEIAEIGVTWYSMLEQGRVENVSTRTLDAIARALRLDVAQRAHLEALAAGAFEPIRVDLTPPGNELLEFVREADFGMAFIVSPAFDVVAWNERADAFFEFSQRGPHPNILRAMLADADLRNRFLEPSGDAVLHRMVGHFRLCYGKYATPEFAALVDELRGFPAFVRAWDECEIAAPPAERSRIRLRDGCIEDVSVMAFTSFWSPAYTLIVKVALERDESEYARANAHRPRPAPLADAHERRSAEFGAFLRARREALRPADIGMISSGRRHARGLRRDEVADRAGLGVSRYTMLEQGRIGSLPAATLRALGDALSLAPRERAYLEQLAASAVARFAADDPPPPADLLAFIRAYRRGGAHFTDVDFNMVACNAQGAAFFGYREGAQQNLLEMMVDDLTLREQFVSPSWEETLGHMLAHYRYTHAPLPSQGRTDLIEALSARCPEFKAAYTRDPGVSNPAVAAARFRLPDRGVYDATVLLFHPTACPGHVLVFMNPVRRGGRAPDGPAA